MTQEGGKTAASWPWLLLALAAHSGWGAYPVFARYLQTVSNLPSMSILALGNLLGVIVAAVFVLPKLDKRVFRLRILWLFGLIVIVRGITNFLAARYTLAIYVQLITQMTPFVVALLSTAVLRQKLPRATLPAILLCLLGAFLMVSSDMGAALTMETAGRQDGLGILLTVISAIALACYMLVVRHTVQYNIPGEAAFVVQVTALSIFSLIVSLLIGEEWAQWRTIGWLDWAIFLSISLGVFVGSNLGQINAIRRLGAPLVSTLISWRLVSALLFGALLLSERLTSGWQLAGAGIVMATITWYVRQQSSTRQNQPDETRV